VQVKDSHSQIKAIKDDIHGNHDGDETEPECFHELFPSVAEDSLIFVTVAVECSRQGSQTFGLDG